jgi:hypothetical protein
VPVGQSAILNSAKFHDNRKGRYEHKRKTRPKPLKHSVTQPQQKTKAFQPRMNTNGAFLNILDIAEVKVFPCPR